MYAAGESARNKKKTKSALTSDSEVPADSPMSPYLMPTSLRLTAKCLRFRGSLSFVRRVLGGIKSVLEGQAVRGTDSAMCCPYVVSARPV